MSLEPGETIVSGVTDSLNTYLLTRKTDDHYQVRVLPEPRQGESQELPGNIDINAQLSFSAPELGAEDDAIEAVTMAIQADTLHLLVRYSRTFWWGIFNPDLQLARADVIRFPDSVSVTGFEFITDTNTTTVFFSGQYDNNQPYWARAEQRQLDDDSPQPSDALDASDAGVYTASALLILNMMLFALN